MPSRGVTLKELPADVQAEVRKRARVEPIVVELGPNSPIAPLPAATSTRRRSEDREHPIQVAIVEWADDLATLPQYPELKTIYAVPSALGAGGKQSKRKRQLEGARRKAEGRRKGMLDLVLPTPRRGDDGRVYGGLYLEIKG
ncbi:MAG: hypothetical protein ACREBE_13770 [bacterium]